MDPVIMMKHLPATFALLLAAACATQPKPCTAEWIDWKSERVFDEFARDHRKQIDELRSSTSGMNFEGERSAAQIASFAIVGARAVALGAEFFRDAVPELNRAVEQCGTAPKATQLFASLLRREGFSPDTVKTIEDLGVVLDRNT